MGATDTFPVDPDYSVTRGKVGNVFTARLDSARQYFRQKAAPQRVFDLVWNRRSVADWKSIENFRLAHMTDFFTFTDKSDSNRQFSVYFNSEPTYEEAGSQQVNIKAELIEAIGAAMATYPSFAAGNPSINIPVANAVDLGVNGKQWLYAGYGYRVNGSGTYTIYLDELVTGGEIPKTDVVLGLHRVRVVTTAGAAPTSLD